MSTKKPKTTILGAGLMGRLTAHLLCMQGHEVEIYEKGGPDGEGSAAKVAAAMLAPLAESVITEPPVVRMGHYSLNRWKEIISRLNDPVFFQQNGTLIVWHRQDSHEAKRFNDTLISNQIKMSFLQAPQELNKEELNKIEPSLSTQFQQGIYLPLEGQLDNRQLMSALLTSLRDLGAKFHWNTPKNLEDFESTCDKGTSSGGWLIDTRGLGARTSWDTLRGVRGEVIRLHAPEVSLSRPLRLVHPRYPLYIAPKEDHVFVVGATEIESEDLSNASVRSTLELLSAAYTVHSGFAEARILEISTQARPTLKDNLPAIRQLGVRTLQLNGLYRHGFLISPAIADCALELMNNGTQNLADSLELQIEKT